MNHLSFAPDGAKLRIVPETREARAWVHTLREASKRIKPGTEKFAIRAFLSWKEGKTEEDFHEVLFRDTPAELHSFRQLAAHCQALDNGRVCDEAVKAWQRRFRETPQYVLIQGNKQGRCTVQLLSDSYEGPTGEGDNFREAKAEAARAFVGE